MTDLGVEVLLSTKRGPVLSSQFIEGFRCIDHGETGQEEQPLQVGPAAEEDGDQEKEGFEPNQALQPGFRPVDLAISL